MKAYGQRFVQMAASLLLTEGKHAIYIGTPRPCWHTQSESRSVTHDRTSALRRELKLARAHISSLTEASPNQ
jgi:hypothetical protein